MFVPTAVERDHVPAAGRGEDVENEIASFDPFADGADRPGVGKLVAVRPGLLDERPHGSPLGVYQAGREDRNDESRRHSHDNRHLGLTESVLVH